MGYKYDIHVHTSEVSGCGKSTAAEQVRAYAAAGYSGIMIVDHYLSDFFEARNGTWEEKADMYLAGYHNAVEEAKKYNIDVLLGVEIRFDENGNDYLVLGLTEQLLKKHRELYKYGIKKFKKFAEQQGLLVVQAHPFRDWCIVQPAEYLDGLETENAHEGHHNNNAKAREYARLHGLRETGGGDCHDARNAGTAGLIFEQRVHDSVELKELVEKGEYQVIPVYND